MSLILKLQIIISCVVYPWTMGVCSLFKDCSQTGYCSNGVKATLLNNFGTFRIRLAVKEYCLLNVTVFGGEINNIL